MKKVFFFFLLLVSIKASSQKTEMWLDSNFYHVKSKPFYYATSEDRGDSGWFVQAWYVKDKSLAIEGWFEDKNATRAHGRYSSFHANKRLKTEGEYVYGKKEGPWVTYNKDGYLIDSSNYYDGLLTGVQMKWYANGIPSDSLFHTAGYNASVIKWNEEGYLIAAGLQDVKGQKTDIWKYYDDEGRMLASEHYSQGKRVKIVCFDTDGKQMSDDKCIDQVASYPGERDAWITYFRKAFRESHVAYNGIKPGDYVVIVEYTIDKEGNVKDIKPLSKNGYGLEDELVRVYEKSPKWKPTVSWGRPKTTKQIFTLYYRFTEQHQHQAFGIIATLSTE